MNFHKINLIKENLYEPSAILDIGCHKGAWTKSMLKIYPNAKYYLFDAENFDIDNNIRNNDKIKIYNYTILYDKICEIDFYKEDIWGTGNSIFKENTSYFDNITPEKKKTNTLNNIINTDNILKNEKNIFLKIDCQGAELTILKGSSLILKKTDFIILEVPVFGEYNKDAPNFEECIKYMESINFIIFDILLNHTIENYSSQSDILFINKDSSFYQNFINKPIIHNVLISDMERNHVINYIKEKKKNNPNYKVIDIGGSADYTSWSYSIIDYIADINVSKNISNDSKIKYFYIDVNFESEWEELLNFVKINGKFDFCLTSHIIEDISLPQVLLNNLKNISKEGFIAFPSKFVELSIIQDNNFIGYIHHKWIYTLFNNELLGFPKLNFIDKNENLCKLGINNVDLMDISLFWKKDVPYTMISNYSTPEELVKNYNKLFIDDFEEIKNIFLYGKVYPIDKIKYSNLHGEIFTVKMRLENIVEDLNIMSKKGYVPFHINKSIQKISNNLGLYNIDLVFINKNSSEIEKFKKILKEKNFKAIETLFY